MDEQKVFAYFREVLVEKFGVAPELVTREATLEQLDLDSLSLVDLLFQASGDLGIDPPDSAAREVKTLGDAIALFCTPSPPAA